METIYSGTITGFSGSWGSGIATLFVNERPVPCENSPTVRALAEAFPDVIGEGHRVNVQSLVGKRILFSTGEFGLLEGFTPEDDADLLHERIDEEGLIYEVKEY